MIFKPFLSLAAVLGLSISSSLYAAIEKQTSLRTFIFGHSLINHTHKVEPRVPTQETSVPHWMYDMAKAQGFEYSAEGQFGIMMTHRENLPPQSEWKFDTIPSIWNSKSEPFTAAGFNSALLTAGNFIQSQAPDAVYVHEGKRHPGEVSPYSATLDVSRWLLEQEPEIKIYIYENWRDMRPLITKRSFFLMKKESFPPSREIFEKYQKEMTGELGTFHQWWLDYHDKLLEALPDAKIRMIPVGPVLGKLLLQAPYNAIPVTEIYQDSAPHGRPTKYFLAAMVTYMAMYATQTPEDYKPPAIIHATVRDNYKAIREFIWQELHAFNDEQGNSRVFFSTTSK